MDLGFAGETRLLVTAEGEVMREDQAPAAIRAEIRARHAARMHAGRDLLTPEEVRQPTTRWHARAPQHRAPEPDLLAMTADLPNRIVQIEAREEFNLPGLNVPGVMMRATLRDGQTVQLGAETREAVSRAIHRRVLALQPPQTANGRDFLRGQLFDLSAVGVTDVTVAAAGEPLREGEDYGVDASAGLIEFKRDVPGEVTASFRVGVDRREVLTLDTQAAYLFGTFDIRQAEPPAGSWIGRLRANRAAGGPRR